MSKEIKIVYVDDIEHSFTFHGTVFKPEQLIEKQKYDRAKDKKEVNKKIEEELDGR